MIKRLFLASMAVIALAACNKETPAPKAVSVAMHGFNFSDDQLEVSMDTTVWDNKPIRPNAEVMFGMTYVYPEGKKDAVLTVKNKTTGATLWQRTINLTSDTLEFFQPIVNFNGQLLDVKTAAPDKDTNRLSFYVNYEGNEDLIDILLYNTTTGAMHYLAEKVKPKTWVYANYIPQMGFQSKGEVNGATVYFLKTGTFDFAFNDSESSSTTSGFGWYLPHNSFTGNKVQPYFLQPNQFGWGIDVVRLFPNPKAY
jgi:hypothetical protein